MDLKVIPGAIQKSDADAIVVGLFEESDPQGATLAVDLALEGAIRALVKGGDLQGQDGQLAVLYPRGAIPAHRVIVVGLGQRDAFNPEAARRAAAHAIQKARDLQTRRVALALFAAPDAVEATAQASGEGCLLALYDYRGQKSAGGTAEVLPQSLELVTSEQDAPAARRGLAAAEAIAAGVAVTRDLVNLPPNICTPEYMAQVAGQMAQDVGLRLQVLGRKKMAALGMGALLAVAQGSDAPPRFIILEHNHQRADKLDSIVLVGKGVTFDTGGYNLKTTEGMATMKGDMAGAAAVIGAMRAIAALDVPLHVVGLAPTADNMISGHAYRPSEVITASNGVSIEIVSTDAEGRLLLADALVFARRFQPAAVVDIATLTGSCAAALGKVAAGLFCTDDALQARLLAAAEASAEKLWPLPLYPEYEKAIESQTADVKNSGGRWGGIGSSAMFLKHFVDYAAWAHVDMAGMEFKEGDTPYVPGKKSATGFGVRLLTEFVRRWES